MSKGEGLQDGMDLRLRRLRRIMEYVRKNQGCDRRSLVGFICLELGARREKAREYIEILEEFGAIYVRSNLYYARKSKKKGGARNR